MNVILGGSPTPRQEAQLKPWCPGVDFTRLPWRSRTEYRFPVVLPSLDRPQNRSLRSVLERLRPDVVVINQPGPDAAQGAIRAAAALRPAVPVACLVHQAPVGLIPMKLLRLKLWWARRIYRRVNGFIAVSNACAGSLREHYGVPEERIRVVWNGVRDVAAGGNGEAALRLRASLGLAPGELMALWIGRLSYEKGVDVLLDALRLTGGKSGVKVFLVGQGELRPQLERQAEGLVKAGTVNFLGWRDDTDELLNACDMVIVPSRLEGFGLLIAEGMSAGKPVAASSVYGTPEVVSDGESGILVPPDDAGALAAAITRLASDGGLRARLGAGGRRRWEGLFTLEGAFGRFSAALDAIISSGVRSKG